MIDRFRRRLTYANVMATVAVFGVLAGGGAYAASKIGASDIAKKAVRTKHIKKGAVTEAKLAQAVKGQVRAGLGDETAVPADVILSYPKLGIRIETDGDADGDDTLVLRNTNTCSPCDINFVTSDDGGSTTVAAGNASAPFVATNRVVDIVAARYTTSDPTRALHVNCGFPLGDPTFCVGIDVKP